MSLTDFAFREHDSSETLKKLLFCSQVGTRKMFLANYGTQIPVDEKSTALKVKLKTLDEYSQFQNLPPPGPLASSSESASHSSNSSSSLPSNPESALIPFESKTQLIEQKEEKEALIRAALLKKRNRSLIKPAWHPPWKLMRVIAGHQGWVRALAVDPTNEWFASGSADRTIKIWDLASGTLKLSLTGHINSIRALACSARSPYLFSAGEDKTVKCWDLETNKTIRSYHGHLSGVYSLALHPTLDVLVTGGRDSTARVWDIRTKQQVRALSGHTNTVAAAVCQSAEPQVITGSHDTTIRLWDLASGKCSVILTNHKKSVRSLLVHPIEYTFASASADNLKVWKCPDGRFLRNLSGHNAIVNTIAVNREGVLASGGDNGSIFLWDWKTGYHFQEIQSIPQPGSLDSESGIFQIIFDQTGSRMITCEADKTIKVWKEDDEATPETHPVNFKPPKKRKKY